MSGRPLAAIAMLALVVANGAPAHGPAHRSGYVSTVLEIRPAVPGLTAVVLGGDALLSVRNWSTREVVVLDATGRPLFRLSSGIVSRRTPAGWRRLKAGTSHTWHDARIHWNGTRPPAAVARDPGRQHEIRRWRIRATADGRPIVILGSLGWVPPNTP